MKSWKTKLCANFVKQSINTTGTQLISANMSKVHPDELKQNSPATLQQTFNKNEDTSPLPSTRSEEITRSIAEYIIHNMCPISTVEGVGFRSL